MTQEFALRFLGGKYRGWDSEQGRFRNFVKGVLADTHRRPLPKAAGSTPPTAVRRRRRGRLVRRSGPP